jgi:hypothetical protein
MQSLTTLTQFTIHMLVPIFMCFFIGMFIDKKAGTSYWMIIMFFVGALAGGKTMERSAAIAAEYVALCIRKTITDPNHWYGVKFETAFPELIEMLQKEG